MLKQTKKIISLPLSKLINSSFNQGVFPTAFKVAKVIPIFKSEPRLSKKSEPISLLSNISKIIEKLMHRRLNDLLEQEKCLCKCQFGFRINSYTNNALMSLTENIRTHLDDGKFVAEVFVDLKRAFDTVDHDMFIAKLEQYGVQRIAIDWFKSYLKGRKQFATIETESSSI